jgi:hypothetical protein
VTKAPLAPEAAWQQLEDQPERLDAAGQPPGTDTVGYGLNSHEPLRGSAAAEPRMLCILRAFPARVQPG